MRKSTSLSNTHIIYIYIFIILILLVFPTHNIYSTGDIEEIEELMKDGNSFLDEGDFTKAITKFKKIIEVEPDNAFAYNNLGLAYKEKDLFSSAKKSFEKALEIIPNYYKALNNLGNLYFEMEEYEDAQEYYEKALEIKPDFPEGHWNLALCYENSGENILALREWRRFISSDEDSLYVPLARNHISGILDKLDE